MEISRNDRNRRLRAQVIADGVSVPVALACSVERKQVELTVPDINVKMPGDDA